MVRFLGSGRKIVSSCEFGVNGLPLTRSDKRLVKVRVGYETPPFKWSVRTYQKMVCKEHCECVRPSAIGVTTHECGNALWARNAP